MAFAFCYSGVLLKFDTIVFVLVGLTESEYDEHAL